MLMTETHADTHRPTAENRDFWTQGTPKPVNSSNFSFRKSDPKTLLVYHTLVKENLIISRKSGTSIAEYQV